MAFSFTLAQGGTLIIPDSSVNINVQNNPSGAVAQGVVCLVGEAAEGPSWSQDAAMGNKLSLNTYGVGDIQRVMSKYGSGNLVDAFRGILSPSASPQITGGPQTIILVKTNNSAAAYYNTLDGHGQYLADIGGEGGNGIQVATTTTQPEVAPSTGNFTYIPQSGTAALAARVNGGAVQTLAISALDNPTSLAAALSGMANLNAPGGVNRNSLQGLTGQLISLAVASGQNVTITLATPNVFTTAPQVGDSMNIPSGSVLAGAGNANVGWYMITSVSSTSGAASLGAVFVAGSAPVAVAPVAISATPNNDLSDYSPIEINNMTGTNRNILTGLIGKTLTCTSAGSVLTVTLPLNSVWTGYPMVGDNVMIPTGSAIAGAGNANVGWYEITLVSNNNSSAFLQLSRLTNGTPVAVTAAVAALTDIQDLDPQIKGLGKSMEIYDNGGAANLNTLFYNLGSVPLAPASWLSQLQVSNEELSKTISVVQNATGSNGSYVVGGNIVFEMGYIGAGTATMTIAQVGTMLMLTTSVSGGPGANLNINLSKIATIADLVAMINSNVGYIAAVGSTASGQFSPSVMDEGTWSIDSSLGNAPGRIKNDLNNLVTTMNGSSLLAYEPEETTHAGLPQDNVATFLSGGLLGGTTGLQFSQAIDALQGVRTNFVVPLMSQNASLDIAAGLTDPSSTYTVAAINAAVKSHCLAMSTPTIKRNRIGIVSFRGSFNNAMASAQTMATFRIAETFMDVLDLNAEGNIYQFQPWMGSVKAAGMQAAGAYKSIFNKTVNISGAIQAANDYDDENTSQVTQALLAGLIPLQLQDTGGYNFVSDQMTYSLDNNFVYNSLQAVYVADLMALDLASSLKTAFVGQSVADVTPGTAESFVKAKMAEYLSLKYTVGSPQQGAPGGWKSISINITPGVLAVNVVALEATSIYFIPINLNIEGIQASTAATGA